MGRQRKNADGQAPPAKSPEERQAEKRQRFLRLAAKRVQRALKALDGVARLANRQNYDYTDDQRDKIIDAIQEAQSVVTRSFSNLPPEKKVFQL